MRETPPLGGPPDLSRVCERRPARPGKPGGTCVTGSALQTRRRSSAPAQACAAPCMCSAPADARPADARAGLYRQREQPGLGWRCTGSVSSTCTARARVRQGLQRLPCADTALHTRAAAAETMAAAAETRAAAAALLRYDASVQRTSVQRWRTRKALDSHSEQHSHGSGGGGGQPSHGSGPCQGAHEAPRGAPQQT